MPSINVTVLVSFGRVSSVKNAPAYLFWTPPYSLFLLFSKKYLFKDKETHNIYMIQECTICNHSKYLLRMSPVFYYKRKKKWSDSVLWQKPLHHTEKSKKQRGNIKKTPSKIWFFYYTTIADQLRTVSWGNSSHPTGVVKPVYKRSTFLLTAIAV